MDQRAEVKEVVQSIGEMMTAFLKSGARSADHVDELRKEIAGRVHSIIVSADDATESYQRACKDFFDKVVSVRGMPTAIIVDAEAGRPGDVSSSGKRVADNFDALRPKILDRLNWCVERYREQATTYLDEQVSQFNDMLLDFLAHVPEGGTKEKGHRGKITAIKREARALAKWDKLFYIYKASSFPSEIDYIFSLGGNPIAAIWHYSHLDEQGEYRKTYDHKAQDGRMYAVRGNWAIKNGFMKAGAGGFFDDITRPRQEVGCICSHQWVYTISGLPADMMTEKGYAELRRVRAIMESGDFTAPTHAPASAPVQPSSDRIERKGWLSRLLERGRPG